MRESAVRFHKAGDFILSYLHKLVSELQVVEQTSQKHRSMPFSRMGVMEKYESVGDYTLWKEILFSHLETMGLMDVLKEKERMEAALVKGAAKVVSSRSEVLNTSLVDRIIMR